MTEPDLTLEEFTPKDAGQLLNLSRSVGWVDHTLENWQTCLTAGRMFGHRTARGEIISSAGVVQYGEQLASIGMVIVHPYWQKRGLSRAALQACFATLQPPTIPVTLVATSQGQPVYHKMGFKIVTGVSRFVAESTARLGATDFGSNPGDTISLLQKSQFEAIARLDATACGGDRTVLLRARWQQSDRGAVLYNSEGQITGFGLRIPQYHKCLIGPLVAPGPEEAFKLVRWLAAGHSGPVKIEVPEYQTGLEKLLGQAGFEMIGSIPVMLLNGSELPGRRRLVFALASPAFG